ncbi:MAG: 4Fe-4S dicluster domain-containing protein [Actinobacteria bacterium]|nr:4Fe-4S dicluster domain-containing protein [Actinomycetota bacterium]
MIKSGKIKVNKELCSGCGICELACSLYHENVCKPSWSRIKVKRKFLQLEFEPQICIQCEWPSCFFECPAKAIEINLTTGARYINEKKCTGCAKCARVCPLMPDSEIIRYKTINGKKIYFKCDLCMDRKEGSLCVEMCPRNALIYIKK